MIREDILDAAAQVFRQKGFHGASMQDVATAVSLQKASLYHHVASKQELLLALLDRALGMLTEHISGIAKQEMPADQKLRQMMCAYLVRWPITPTFPPFYFLNIVRWIKNPTPAMCLNAISLKHYGGMFLMKACAQKFSIAPIRAWSCAV